MRTRRWILALLCGALVLSTGTSAARGGPTDDDAPSATRVVVRGKQVFAEALAAAAQPAWAGAAPRPILLVFDVTPHVQRSRTAIEEGLAALASEASAVTSWSVAALGGKPCRRAASATALGTSLGKALATETDVVSTLTALASTLKSWREKDGVVVFVADWHFEDDVDLEGFIQSLLKKGRTLSVVGTEAAFRRGWNDGLRDFTERFENDVRGSSTKDYWEGVGRDPFGGRDTKAPWHGGDTAYPLAPYRWADLMWDSSFSSSDWKMADLNAEVGDPLEGAGGIDEVSERMAEIQEELERVEGRLGRPDLDPTEKTELEARRDELAAEQEKLLRELLKGFGGGFAEDAKRIERLEALRTERGDVNAKLGDVLAKLLDTEDEADEARLEAEQAQLEAERDRLTEEIERLEAELAAPESPGDRPSPGTSPPPPFAPGDDIPDPEELKGRLPGGSVPDDLERPEWIDTDDVIREFPLPSSFGPYGLMRAAGVTGGRYVLFSWNPSGRKTVVYEYSRCNLFPPDLRSRKSILADLRENAWARSMLAAWWALVDARVDVLEQLPPLRGNLRSACGMDRAQDTAWIPHSWESPGEQKQCIRLAGAAVEALDRALKILDEGLADAGEPRTDVDQRYHAEALLFRHAARVARFELRETIAVAKEVPRSAFRKKGEKPGVLDEWWVRRGRNPEKVRTWREAGPRDIDAGLALLEERKALLERFRGTPLGEELAMNTIDTARPVSWEETGTVPDTGRSPSQSTDTPKPTPPPPSGGSTGGGPTTGGG